MRAVLLLAAALSLAGCSANPPEVRTEPPPAEQKTAAAKVKDPVCGMMVDPATAEKATYQGKTYYFCAREERIEFEKNPEKYVKN